MLHWRFCAQNHLFLLSVISSITLTIYQQEPACETAYQSSRERDRETEREKLFKRKCHKIPKQLSSPKDKIGLFFLAFHTKATCFTKLVFCFQERSCCDQFADITACPCYSHSLHSQNNDYRGKTWIVFGSDSILLLGVWFVGSLF